MDARVVELANAERVAQQITDGPEEWIGTTISFDLGRVAPLLVDASVVPALAPP